MRNVDVDHVGLARRFLGGPVGPISLLLIRSVLRDGVMVGLAIGVGVALVDAIFARQRQQHAHDPVLGAAIFAAAVVARAGRGGALELLAGGAAAGSSAWFAELTAAVVPAGRRLGPRARRAIDLAAGRGLLAFGSGLFGRALALRQGWDRCNPVLAQGGPCPTCSYKGPLVRGNL